MATRGARSATRETELAARLSWQLGVVVELIRETPRTCSIVLEMPDWPGHLAGQHVDVRLTAEDGYQAQRSYSIASAPEEPRLVITVERLDDGEVSPYLADELRAGDELELRGPIGGYFVWRAESDLTPAADPAPVLLVAGGSGVVPFRSMLRHHRAAGSAAPMRLLYSARTLDGVIYRDELSRLSGSDGIDVELTLTREGSDGWAGRRGRVSEELLRELSWPASDAQLSYICGPNAFVETAAAGLVALGHPPQRILTERFGPTG